MAPPSKRRKTSKIPEISFDPTSRSEYLTGFRKRKQARIKASQEKAAERARQEKILERAEARKRRKEEVEEHVRAVNEASGLLNGDAIEEENGDGQDGGEWEGFDEPVVEVVNRQDEYIDEEKFTTVTVEEVTISRDGLNGPNGVLDSEEEDGEKHNGEQLGNDRSQQKRTTENGTKRKSKSKSSTDAKKKRKKSFKYESKDERKFARAKQKARNSKQAVLRKDSGNTRSRR